MNEPLKGKSMSSQHAVEIKAGHRFSFGKNWMRFLAAVDEYRILQAEQSLCEMLAVTTLQGKTFLDIGSGSGLFSLAARRLGAKVHSFDFDPQSVACTRILRQRYFSDDKDWTVEQGSVLDKDYLISLGQWDYVYSWGVLHHTGQMYQAFTNVTSAVKMGGKLFIAIYNDQGVISKYWSCVKCAYNTNTLMKMLLIVFHAPYLIGARWILRIFNGGLPLERGMSLWCDMIDWLGGFPFEAAKPDDVVNYFQDRGFVLEEKRLCGNRMGCNEFVFCCRV